MPWWLWCVAGFATAANTGDGWVNGSRDSRRRHREDGDP